MPCILNLVRASPDPHHPLFPRTHLDHRLPVVKLALEGQLDKAVCQYAESEGLQLVALHLKMGDKTLPPDVVGLIRSCKAAVLLYRDILQ